MNDYDDRIRRALDAQARRMPTDPDPADLTDRISRRERRRTRALSAALVLAVFAGPTLGFVAGRGDNGKDTIDTADDGSGGGGGDGVTLASPGALPTLRPAGSSGFGDSQTFRSSPEDPMSSRVAPGIDASQSTILYAGGMTNEQLAHVFGRDHRGMKIRVYRAAVTMPSGVGPPWWTPPGWCFPNGYVQADISNDDMVGIAYGSVFAELREGVVGGSLGVIGVSEGSAQWVAVVQAPANAASVRVTFPGGATDEMEPVEGVAVLVGAADISPDDDGDYYSNRAELEAFDGSGGSLGTGTATFGGMDFYAYSEEEDSAAIDTANSCIAPQELPAPGPEQPADVAAARQAVTDAFLLAHGAHDETQEQMMTAIDDPTNFPDYWNTLANGAFKDQVNAAVVGLDDVVFESATRAAIKYHWDVPGYGTSFHNRFGELVLVDGVWKVTRESMCQDFALAGVQCE